MSTPTPAHLAKVADTLGTLKIFTRYYGGTYIATAHRVRATRSSTSDPLFAAINLAVHVFALPEDLLVIREAAKGIYAAEVRLTGLLADEELKSLRLVEAGRADCQVTAPAMARCLEALSERIPGLFTKHPAEKDSAGTVGFYGAQITHLGRQFLAAEKGRS